MAKYTSIFDPEGESTTSVLEEIVFIGFTVLVVFVVLIGISKDFVLDLLGLGLLYLFCLLGLLCLSLDLSLRCLDLLVLDHVARFDDIRDGVVVENILALLDDFLNEDSCQMDLSVALLYNIVS